MPFWQSWGDQTLTLVARRAYRFPSVEETLAHPAFPGTIWALEPHSHGKVAVAKDRGGPVDIAWEIHGSGPVKLVVRPPPPPLPRPCSLC